MYVVFEVGGSWLTWKGLRQDCQFSDVVCCEGINGAEAQTDS